MGKQLNIGFIVHADEIPAWYAETISLIAKENHRLFFLRFPQQKKEMIRGSLLHRLFTLFEDKWFKPVFDAHKPVSLKQVLPNANVAEMHAEGYVVDESSLDKLNAFPLDIIYTTGFHPSLKENISSAARQGLWYVHFGYDEYNNSPVPAFWEVMDNQPVAGSYLLMRKGDRDFVLYEGTTTIVPFSVKNTIHTLAWRASSYLLHRTRTLTALGTSFATIYHQLFNLQAQRKLPGHTKMAFLFFRNLRRYLRYKRKLNNNTGRFTLLVAEEAFALQSVATAKFNALPLPPGHFFADPFILEKDGVRYLFFEDHDDRKGKAHISVMEINRQGEKSSPHIVLDKPYHLSYPFMFEMEGHYYLLPETSANQTVELYRAVSFPYQWELEKILLQGRALIDCTVFFRDGVWWLFACEAGHPATSTNDQLFLFYSKDPFSSFWTPHPKNPVATHAGNCRPAGRIIEKDGKLYRPAQNNASVQYGYGLNINEIEVLTKDDYHEKPVRRILPESFGLKAMHHLEIAGNFIVIDGIV